MERLIVESSALCWKSAAPTCSNCSLKMSRNKQINNMCLLIKPKSNVKITKNKLMCVEY